MKRVVIYGMNYSPEIAGVGRYTGEIAEYLAESGIDVTVVTTPPHYPGWRILQPFGNAFSRETHRNVSVYRCPLLLREKMGGFWRLIAPLSFATSSAAVAVSQILLRRPDVVVCIEPTLLSAPLGLLAAKLIGAKTVLHVQDLEVDAAFAVRHLRDHRVLRWLGGLFERSVRSRFDKVLTISNRMSQQLVAKGIAPERVSVVRNWVDLTQIKPAPQPSPYRAELGFGDDDFVVLYSGNIGAKQGLDILLDAASQLDDGRIRFVIGGDGPAKAALRDRYGNFPNVTFVPFQPAARLNDFLNLADLHVLPQDVAAADLVLPSKLGGMLATGTQVLVTAKQGSELAEFLGEAALIVPPGDATVLARAIVRAADEVPASGREARLRLARSLSADDGKPEWVRHVLEPTFDRRA